MRKFYGFIHHCFLGLQNAISTTEMNIMIIKGNNKNGSVLIKDT